MEVLKYEGQLGKGTKMFRVDSTRPRIDEYEFLCKNPHNSKYAILIDTLTHKPVQIYIKDLLSGSYYLNYKPSEAIGKLAEIFEDLAKGYREFQSKIQNE
jgi:hypothetical protein